MQSNWNIETMKAENRPEDTQDHATQHGLLRTVERTGKSAPQALRLIHNAWLRGKTAEALPKAWQRKYVARCRYRDSLGFSEPRVYGDYLFIFSQAGNLITMHRLPKNFHKKRIYDGKMRVRKAKKYARFQEHEEPAERGVYAAPPPSAAERSAPPVRTTEP